MKLLNNRLPLRWGMVFPLLLVFLGSCAGKKPVLILQPEPVGHAGKTMRELYRSFWQPPAGDQDMIRIGLLTDREEVRFRVLADSRIKVIADRQQWEVASPGGVIWKVRSLETLRPPVVSYYSVVETGLFATKSSSSTELVRKWVGRGYASTRWIGPSEMDVRFSETAIERRALSLTPPTGQNTASKICKEVTRKWKSRCMVLGRIELPPLIRGRLTAENSSFSQEYEGVLEIHSPRAPVEVFDVVPEERTAEVSVEKYGPRLMVVPGLNRNLNLVQTTSLGNYLEGVVPAEIFPRAPAGALQAQAIVARTYALRHLAPKDSTQPFYICGSTRCQVYRGVDYKQERTSEAVEETRGLVIWEDDTNLAETFYHAICGGHTEPRLAIWGYPAKPYLEGSSDEIPGIQFAPMRNDAEVDRYLKEEPHSYCGVASFTKEDRWRWKENLNAEELRKVLSQNSLKPPLTKVQVLKRGISGRVLEIALVTKGRTKTIQGELNIRRLFGGLLSSLFVLDPIYNDRGELTSLEIRGGAYGHGVGLCQMGAIGRAEAGQDFREIISSYYPGTRLAPLTGSMVR